MSHPNPQTCEYDEISLPLLSYTQLTLRQKDLGEPFTSEWRIKLAIPDFEDGVGACERTEEQSLGAESDPRLTARKEMKTLVLQLHGTELCQQPGWAQKQILSQSLQLRVQATKPWFQPVRL